MVLDVHLCIRQLKIHRATRLPGSPSINSRMRTGGSTSTVRLWTDGQCRDELSIMELGQLMCHRLLFQKTQVSNTPSSLRCRNLFSLFLLCRCWRDSL
uniref:Uncharacterized protein n=1 Tax=Anguilla anguilla TaxID=7936 RepID=A0A0E9V0B3_ANGAN